MNRSLEGWRTWYTIPLPNIGLFYVRGNAKTVRMFHLAWDEYQVSNNSIVLFHHLDHLYHMLCNRN